MRTCIAGISLLLTLGGCLEAESTTTLERNGKGTYVQVVTVDMEKARAFHAFQEEQVRGLGIPDEGAEKEDPFAELDTSARAKALEKRGGVRVVASAPRENEAGTHVTWATQVEFDSLRRLFDTAAVEGVDARLERTEDGKAWKLTLRHAFDGTADEGEDESEALRRMRAAMLARYERFWGSLRVVSTLRLPTQVLDTNGERSEDRRSVTWRVGFADLADPRRLVQEVTFADAPDLTLEAFHVTAADVANMLEAEALEAERAAAEREGKDDGEEDDGEEDDGEEGDEGTR